jgi:hypothetical protein
MHENCVICLDEFELHTNTKKVMSYDKKFKNKISLTVCGHILHSKCFKEWIEHEAKCPLCREELNSENIEKW